MYSGMSRDIAMVGWATIEIQIQNGEHYDPTQSRSPHQHRCAAPGNGDVHGTAGAGFGASGNMRLLRKLRRNKRQAQLRKAVRLLGSERGYSVVARTGLGSEQVCSRVQEAQRV